MSGQHFSIENKEVLKDGVLPNDCASWKDVAYEWIYKEESPFTYRICQKTGRLERFKKSAMLNQTVFDDIYQNFHQEKLTKVDVGKLPISGYTPIKSKWVGYGVLVDLEELNHDCIFDELERVGLEYQTVCQYGEQKIIFMGEFVAQSSHVILLEKVKVFPSDNDTKELKEKLISIGLTEENIRTLGLHHYIL